MPILSNRSGSLPLHGGVAFSDASSALMWYPQDALSGSADMSLVSYTSTPSGGLDPAGASLHMTADAGGSASRVYRPRYAPTDAHRTTGVISGDLFSGGLYARLRLAPPATLPAEGEGADVLRTERDDSRGLCHRIEAVRDGAGYRLALAYHDGSALREDVADSRVLAWGAEVEVHLAVARRRPARSGWRRGPWARRPGRSRRP